MLTLLMKAMVQDKRQISMLDRVHTELPVKQMLDLPKSTVKVIKTLDMKVKVLVKKPI